jgi:hypothetical protein
MASKQQIVSQVFLLVYFSLPLSTLNHGVTNGAKTPYLPGLSQVSERIHKGQA